MKDTLIRVYKGSPETANLLFAKDAETLSNEGYVPTSQSYQYGQHSTGAFIVALFLLIFCIGIIVLLYLIMKKPDGALTVTYTLKSK